MFLETSVLMSYDKNTTGDNQQSLKVERENGKKQDVSIILRVF